MPDQLTARIQPDTDADVEEAPARTSEEDAALNISTEITPPKLMRIDGQEYQLLNFDHLSPTQEAKVTATFARFQRVFLRLSDAPNEDKAEEEAGKVLRLRTKLITLMTTIPADVVATYGPVTQGKILEAIREEIGTQSGSQDPDSDADDLT